MLSLQEEEEKEQDTPDNVLDKNKGIEMTDKFKGKEYSLSEDSEEDKEDEEPGSDRIEVRPSDGDCNCWPIITVAGHFQLW